jgi:hypothetical protein
LCHSIKFIGIDCLCLFVGYCIVLFWPLQVTSGLFVSRNSNKLCRDVSFSKSSSRILWLLTSKDVNRVSWETISIIETSSGGTVPAIFKHANLVSRVRSSSPGSWTPEKRRTFVNLLFINDGWSRPIERKDVTYSNRLTSRDIEFDEICEWRQIREMFNCWICNI